MVCSTSRLTATTTATTASISSQMERCACLPLRLPSLFALLPLCPLSSLQTPLLQVTPDLTSVTATIQAASVTVRAALMGVQERASALGRLERGRINRTIAKDVLKSREFSTIAFSSESLSETEAGYALRGKLTLRGATRSVMTTAFREGARLHARLPLKLSEFGVRPVTAFMGALRVSDELCVVIDLPDGS